MADVDQHEHVGQLLTLQDVLGDHLLQFVALSL